jgi:hypothetical protein
MTVRQKDRMIINSHTRVCVGEGLRKFCLSVFLSFWAINFNQFLHISEIFCTFAVDLVKRYRSIHILLTALAIISRSKKKSGKQFLVGNKKVHGRMSYLFKCT